MHIALQYCLILKLVDVIPLVPVNYKMTAGAAGHVQFRQKGLPSLEKKVPPSRGVLQVWEGGGGRRGGGEEGSIRVGL